MTSARDQFDHEFEAFLVEEESRLAALYRKLPRLEPEAKLDAAVHSMAHRALNPQLVATPRTAAQRQHARWLPVLGAAAGIVLAAGIALRVEIARRSEHNELGAPSSDVVTVRQLDLPPPPPAEPPLSPAPPPLPGSAAAPQAARATGGKPEGAATPGYAYALKPAPAPEREKVAAKLAEPEGDRLDAAAAGSLKEAETSAKSAPAPQAFPSQAQKRASEMDAVERKQIMAAGAWQNLHDHDTGESARSNAKAKSLDDKAPAGASSRASPTPQVSAPAASESAVTREAPAAAAPSSMQQAPVPASQPLPLRDAAQSAAAARADGSSSAARDEPAAAPGAAGKEAAVRARSADPNAGLYPEHWLANIRAMLKDNRRDEAVRSLAEFRKSYPGYHLPDDLRDLK